MHIHKPLVCIRAGRYVAICVWMLTLFTLCAQAQEYRGTIYGQVTDGTGGSYSRR